MSKTLIVDHPILTDLVGTLISLRKQSKWLSKQEDKLKDEIKGLMTEFPDIGVVTPRGKVQIVVATRRTVDRTRLLEIGVAPGLIDEATKESTSSSVKTTEGEDE